MGRRDVKEKPLDVANVEKKRQNILWMERSERQGTKRIILKGCCQN
jgi:hypothetical protein